MEVNQEFDSYGIPSSKPYLISLLDNGWANREIVKRDRVIAMSSPFLNNEQRLPGMPV